MSEFDTNANIEIRRSARRRKSVQAFREGDKTIVSVPLNMPQDIVDQYVADLVGRLDRRQANRSDQGNLEARARRISLEFLNRDVFIDWPKPLQISWVANQNSRWGSCTPGTGVIRISDRIQPMPDYVVDCVILHELAHLFHLAHDDKFYAIANLHPKSGEAAAYLDGFSLGARLEMSFD